MKLIQSQSMLGRFDWVLAFAILVLISIGLTTIWSVAISREGSDLGMVNRQLAALFIGLFFVFFFSLANYRLLKNYSLLIWIAGVLMLVAVLVFGRTVRGTTGWFSFFGWNFQPVEFAKFALIVFLAKYLSDHPRGAFLWREFLISGLGVAIIVGLVMFQPDFGSALVLLTTWLGLLLLSRIRKIYAVTVIGSAILVIVFAWFFLASYQKDRILTFLNPSLDPLGRGYNVTQSIIAVGSGGFMGRGLGFGSQTQMRFLPESQTDFIFAVIAEQFGFVGAALVLVGFMIIFNRLIKLANTASDDFTAFLSLGFLLSLFTQFIINIGMNIGLVPVTGIALPFVSYGGSSLLMSLLFVGILESIAVRRPLTQN